MSVSKIIDNQYESFLSNAILIRDENEQLEFKRMNKKPAELLESVVAFSNSKGGILVL
jgi:predicted HTH transcriptional regulator